MISGGNGGWFGFEDGEDTGDGEVAGETVSIVGDMTAAMLASCLVGSLYNRREKSALSSIVSFDDDQLAEACQQALGITPGSDARARAVVEDSKRLGDSLNRCASRSTAVGRADRRVTAMFGEECLDVVATGRSQFGATRSRDESSPDRANSRMTRRCGWQTINQVDASDTKKIGFRSSKRSRSTLTPRPLLHPMVSRRWTSNR